MTDENVQKVLSNHQFGTCQISNASLFDNPEYDVLKFDVSGNSLHECNSDLRKYPYTSNFPDYHPHMTIGYLNKGMGKKYTKLFENHQHTLIPQYAIYSKPNGSKTKFKINVK